MLKNNSNKRGLNEKKNIELHFFFFWAGCCLHCVSVSLAANFCSPMFACLFFLALEVAACLKPPYSLFKGT